MAITLHKDLTGADLHAPGAHKTQHEDGGSDEISLTGLAGSPALGSSTTVVTQSQGDNSTKPASTAYVDTAVAAVVDGVTFTGDVVVPDEAYDAAAWNGSLEVPTKNAVRDKIETLAPLAGATFTGDINVPDEAYDATTWNGSTEVPTKNAIRDKIESLAAGGAPTNASYVTLGANGTLSDERVLTAGSGISITDGGAGSTVTIASTGGVASPEDALDQAPGSPNVADDEMAGSGDIDTAGTRFSGATAWTKRNWGTGLTWDYDNGEGVWDVPSTISAKMMGIDQALPSGAVEYIVKCQMIMATGMSGWGQSGIYWYDSVGGKVEVAGLEVVGADDKFSHTRFNSIGDPNSTWQSNPANISGAYGHRRLQTHYVRFTRDGSNNITVDIAFNRRKWRNLVASQSHTAFLANAPDRIGYMYVCNAFAVTFFFKYWRRTA